MIFETLLTSLDSQMHFFQQGTLCSQSDASLVFSQSHSHNMHAHTQTHTPRTQAECQKIICLVCTLDFMQGFAYLYKALFI